MPGKVTVWVKGLGGEPLPARESSAAGGPSAARMRQAASKKDDLMEVIADLGLVVWCFITLIFLFLFWFLFSLGCGPRCSTQRAGIAPPRAEGDKLSAFISVPASFVGGVPLTRAMNPWAMPEAST